MTGPSPEPERTSRRLRYALAALSAVLAALALLMPAEWYRSLPRDPALPPRPFDGILLLRATFLLESLLAGAFAITGWRPAGTVTPTRHGGRSFVAENGDMSRRQAMLALGCVTALALLLRLYRLDADLWLDEIATVATYAARPLAEVYATYLSPGNHLLNSLMLKLSVMRFGESEWSVRIPSVAFGVGTIPAMYLAARLAMSRTASAGAALLLAVSYHHIFFSQNARGYTGHLLFTLLSSTLLASALTRGRLPTWTMYVLSMTLGFAALMTTAFTFGAHALVAAALVTRRWMKREPEPGQTARVVIAFAATGVLAFQVYALSIPDILAIYPTVYAVQGSGYLLFSTEFVTEIVRGVSAGFRVAGALALPFLITAVLGLVILLRRNWILTTSLALTVALTVVFLLIGGQSIAPRMLLTGVPLAILSGMALVDAGSVAAARRLRLSLLSPRALTVGAIVILTVPSLFALPAYYSHPRQPYRSAIHHLERQHGGAERVIVVFPAVGGFRYYLKQEGVDTGRYAFVTTSADYDAAFTPNAGGQRTLVTTLFRVLRSTSPDLADKVERDWVPVTTLRGTLGDGDISLWQPRGR